MGIGVYILMENLYFAMEKERDSYTGKDHNVLYLYINEKSLLWMEDIVIELGSEEEKTFTISYTNNNVNRKYESKKEDKKIFTFLNKLIKKKFYYYNIKIVNINNIIRVDDIESIYSIELFNEKLEYLENGVSYEF